MNRMHQSDAMQYAAQMARKNQVAPYQESSRRDLISSYQDEESKRYNGSPEPLKL
jgi:hypothetical protein